jgi:hypothetical protein
MDRGRRDRRWNGRVFSRTLISRRDAGGRDGGVREELAAGVSLNALSVFGVKQTCTVVWLRPPRS